jgi:hypothetical protein
MVNNFMEDCAINSYKEEFEYFEKEGGDDFISLCKELFIEENGKEEAFLLNWNWIHNQLRKVNKPRTWD